MVPSCSDTWQFSIPTSVSQLKPRVLQEKCKIRLIKGDLLQQHHHLVLSTSVVTRSLEGG